MKINFNQNNNQPNFKQRLYLKYIKRNEMPYMKGIAKDFNQATKDFNGRAFTLIGEPNGYSLTSNNKIMKVTIPPQPDREKFLNELLKWAQLIRRFDTLLKDEGGKVAKKNKKAAQEVNHLDVEFKVLNFDGMIEYLDNCIKNKGKK